MFERLLVPLDGSQFSECSLDKVKAVALGCKVGDVILLSVVEPLTASDSATLAQARGSWGVRGEHTKEVEGTLINHADYADHSLEHMGEKRSMSEAYLAEIARRLAKEGIAARGEVVVGKAAETILDYADKHKVDLIVMSTHGRSGISRWAFGSVADKVARLAAVPLLLVPPAGCRAPIV